MLLTLIRRNDPYVRATIFPHGDDRLAGKKKGETEQQRMSKTERTTKIGHNRLEKLEFGSAVGQVFF